MKADSRIHYHSFVELLAFDPDRAVKALAGRNSLLEQLKQFGLTGSLVPHAPYSVSPALVFLITRQCADAGLPTSIHMLESNDETEFFVQGTGLYRRLYHDMGMAIDFFEPSGRPHWKPCCPGSTRWRRPCWCTIPLPRSRMCSQPFRHQPVVVFLSERQSVYRRSAARHPSTAAHHASGRITWGTDSLASNHQLSIWQEMLTIMRAYPDISLESHPTLGCPERRPLSRTGANPGVSGKLVSARYPAPAQDTISRIC